MVDFPFSRCVFVNIMVNFYDFNKAKLVKMEEDGEESDEITDIEDSDTDDI